MRSKKPTGQPFSSTSDPPVTSRHGHNNGDVGIGNIDVHAQFQPAVLGRMGAGFEVLLDMHADIEVVALAREID